MGVPLAEFGEPKGLGFGVWGLGPAPQIPSSALKPKALNFTLKPRKVPSIIYDTIRDLRQVALAGVP